MLVLFQQGYQDDDPIQTFLFCFIQRREKLWDGGLRPTTTAPTPYSVSHCRQPARVSTFTVAAAWICFCIWTGMDVGCLVFCSKKPLFTPLTKDGCGSHDGDSSVELPTEYPGFYQGVSHHKRASPTPVLKSIFINYSVSYICYFEWYELASETGERPTLGVWD